MLGILIGVLFVGLFLTVPIALSLAIATLVVFMVEFPGTPMVNNLAQAMLVSADSFPLMAIPFFMLMGTLMEKTGLAKRLIDIAELMTEGQAGGLGITVIIASVFFATVSGSGPATAAAIGAIMLPAMATQGYDKPYSTSLVAAASIIGPIIPPSIPLIMYGVTVGVSVTQLFVGGIIPGLLMAGTLIGYNYVTSHKRGYRSVAVPRTSDEKRKVLVQGLGALGMPLVVLGGIYGGIFTPTESAVVGVMYTLIFGLVARELSFKRFKEATVDAAVTASTVMILFGPATTFGRLLTLGRVPEQLTYFMTNLTDSPLVVLLLTNVMLIVMGMFIDTISAIMLTAPLFAPLLISFGYDPIFIGVVIVVNLCIGMITPPLSANMFVAMRIGGTRFEETVKEIFPMLLALLITLVLMLTFPGIITFLPNLFF